MKLSLSVLIYSYLATFAICETVDYPRILARQTASRPLFHHRGFHNSIIVGNYLYIDGGEVTLWDGTGDGVQTENPQSNGNILTQAVNDTYSIDLSQSWTNSTVSITTIRKTAPVVNNQALWLDASNKTIYAYDGGISGAPQYWYNTHPPANSIWQMTPSDGSGSWQQTYVSTSSNFTNLVRATIGIYASGNGLGFALGGVQDDHTSYDLFTTNYYDKTYVPGMVIYNTSSQEWYNASSTGYSYSGFAMAGAAQFVPSFGPNGLLFVLGGTTGPKDNTQYAQFNYVWMYDPVSQRWTSQKVSGDIPSETQNQCVVGAQGDEGTYEIFMYGGQYSAEVEATVQNGVVHVLSLPSFNWQKQAAPATIGRFMHSCNAIGRQMISVGGVTMYSDTEQEVFNVDGGVPDPWDQGFGVFDMTDMEWKSSYDANAGAYSTPQSIKSHSQQNGRFPSEWSDSIVEDWFTNPGSKKSSNSSGFTGSSNGNSNGSSTSTGAIAGGVVGGLLGLALIAGLIWFLLRRRRRSEYHRPQMDNRSTSPAEHDGYARMHTLPAEADSHQMIEMPVGGKAERHSPAQVHELEGRYPR